VDSLPPQYPSAVGLPSLHSGRGHAGRYRRQNGEAPRAVHPGKTSGPRGQPRPVAAAGRLAGAGRNVPRKLRRYLAPRQL